MHTCGLPLFRGSPIIGLLTLRQAATPTRSSVSTLSTSISLCLTALRRVVLLSSLLMSLRASLCLSATPVYVWQDSPVNGPGTTWNNAFHTIQAGINAASPGVTVVVTNGTYVVTTPISVNKAVTLKSVNGSAVTLVDGSSAVRCLALADTGAVVCGFTFQNGDATGDVGGGIAFSVAGGEVRECRITSSRADYGGGVFFAAAGGLLDRCVLTGCRAVAQGGGVYLRAGVTVRNCLIYGNLADYGGGVLSYQGGLVQDCTVCDNEASSQGGGAFAYEGGSYFNTILYFNTSSSGANWSIRTTGAFAYCCLTPDSGGKGNVTGAPEFIGRSSSNYRVLDISPCRDTGRTDQAGGAYDLDGLPRILNSTVDIGCYEYAGEPLVSISTPGQSVLWNTASFAVSGTCNSWVEGSLVAVNAANAASAGFAAAPAWTAPALALATGTNVITVTGTNVAGLVSSNSVVIARKPRPTITYVSPSGGHVAPFERWQDAATNIQAAADAVATNGTVWVTNGIYFVAVPVTANKALTLRSVNGSASTVVDGNNASRCLLVTATSVTVSGFTFQRGYDAGSGGGVYVGATGFSISNCVVASCAAQYGAGVLFEVAGSGLIDRCIVQNTVGSGDGGGVFLKAGVTIRNSLIYGNSAYNGGGLFFYSGGSAVNCTLTGNHATNGGGLFFSGSGSAVNSILYGNTAAYGANHYMLGGSLTYCCATPQPSGNGNIDADPQFSSASGYDYRLLPSSPCLNSGSNADAGGTLDLDGHPRILGYTVDRGCYELLGPPFVDITTPDQTVAWDMSAFSVSGTNNGWIVGALVASNAANAANATFTNASPWSAPALALITGANVITVFGTNLTGVAASDSVTITRQAPAVTYVSPNGGHVAPFESWQQAATNIQVAVDAVGAGGTVWVSNGTYRVCTPVTLNKSLSLRSLNGSAVTILDGQGACRCAYVAQSNVTMVGFTLTAGAAAQGGGLYVAGTRALIQNCRIFSCAASEGGGVYLAASGAVLEGCTLADNTALSGNRRGGGLYAAEPTAVRLSRFERNQAEDGAGIYASQSLVLENSLIANNTADFQGGGLTLEAYAQMANCTIARNSAFTGGGACWQSTGRVENCILYDNSAFGLGTNYLLQAGAVVFRSCCTWPAPPGGTGTVLASPQFYSADTGDYHLGPASPCVDVGTNSAAAGITDLDGAPRILGTRVDIGAYEWAAVRYVSPQGSHTPPFWNWAAAATNIQPALERSRAGDLVVVTDGIYLVSSQITVTQAVTLASVNGSDVTIIDAQQQSRCLLISHAGAEVNGFTIKRGQVAGENGGGVYFGAAGGTVRHCDITGCYADSGFGVYFSDGAGLLEDCDVFNNTPPEFSGYRGYGGGIQMTRYGAIARRCRITGNKADMGAGVNINWGGELQDCLIAGNNAFDGGGVCFGWLNSIYPRFRNCTITANYAIHGGGIYQAGQGRQDYYNCIIYHNSARDYGADAWVMPGGALYFWKCCISSPEGGADNIYSPPQFADFANGNFRLSPASPCINIGNNGYVGGSTDLDGRSRILHGSVDLGAYERVPLHYVSPSGTHTDPFETWTSAATNIQAALAAAHAGAQVVVTNGLYDGSLDVTRSCTLTSVNGRDATRVNGHSNRRCLRIAAAATVDGFTFEEGSTNTGGGISVNSANVTLRNCTVRRCVADEGAGVYFAEGTGTLQNCTIQNNRAVSGAGRGGGIFAREGVAISNTVVEGNQALDGGGAYLYQGGTLLQCRVATNNAAVGGGAYLYQGGTVERCVVTTNRADTGGGVYIYQSGTVVNSLLTTNGAQNGGGAYFNFGGTLRNCTVQGNTAATNGGGVVSKSGTMIENSILWRNSAGVGGTNWFNIGTGMTYDHCCTAPTPGGSGHVTQAPGLSADGRHLLYGSPCVDAGKDMSGVVTNDLDNRPRPVDGNFDSVLGFDIGACEYDPQTADSNSDGIPDGWCHHYGLDPTQAGLALGNPDGDAFTTGDEWIADTNPTNNASTFSITALSNGVPKNVWVNSSTARVYTLQWRERLESGVWQDTQGQTALVPGNGGALVFSHNNPSATSAFYRVRVQLP